MENINLFKNNDLDIFIYSHIPFKPVTNDHTYKILTNSKCKSSDFNTDLEIFRDYYGDNISNNNLMYNEYCGLYWIYKNYPIKKYIGLNHYRRIYTTDNGEVLEHDKLPSVDKIFENHDIILNKPLQLRMFNGMDRGGELFNNYDWYKCWHNIDDLNLLGDIINDLYPNLMDGYQSMLNKTYLYPSSMFIMKRDDFIKYCDFIFNVLNEFRIRRCFYNTNDCIKYVQEHSDLYIKKEKGHDYYDVEKQSRIIGYIAERALATYLMHGGDNSIESKAKIFNWALIAEKYWKIN